MVRLDHILLGYYYVFVDERFRKDAADILLRKGISAVFDKKGRFVISYGRLNEIERLFEKKIEYSVSELCGLRKSIIQIGKRYGMLFGLISLFFLFIFLQSLVWDIRIEGVTSEKSELIIEELEKAGLKRGNFWFKTDRSSIELSMLRDSESVSWININRRGTVAYVTVSEKKVNNTDKENDLLYANIVASRDCVIEEICVEEGVAMVKEGESVKAGQLIISGVIPGELGGGYCFARGSVIGRYSEALSVDVKNTVIKKVYGSPSVKNISLKLFNFKINIFKRTGQSEDGCDIIEEKKSISLSGKTLPVYLIKTYAYSYSTQKVEMSEEEIINSASSQIREVLNKFLNDKEAQRIKTEGTFTEDGYRMTCHMVVSSDIAKTQEFGIEKEK